MLLLTVCHSERGYHVLLSLYDDDVSTVSDSGIR
jgi:hypothetical protein